MIKLDKENFKIETDCKKVGEFMTEAAAIFGGNVNVIVDGCRYEFHDTPKIRVTDETPLGSVSVERADSLLSGFTVLRVTTAPKPKTVKKSGWVNIWRSEMDGLTYCGDNIYGDKALAERVGKDCGNNIATVRVEWEEEAQ